MPTTAVSFINAQTIYMYAGASLLFPYQLRLTPSNANGTLYWESGDTGIVSVLPENTPMSGDAASGGLNSTSYPYLRAHKPGTTTITVYANASGSQIKATVTIIVEEFVGVVQVIERILQNGPTTVWSSNMIDTHTYWYRWNSTDWIYGGDDSPYYGTAMIRAHTVKPDNATYRTPYWEIVGTDYFGNSWLKYGDNRESYHPPKYPLEYISTMGGTFIRTHDTGSTPSFSTQLWSGSAPAGQAEVSTLNISDLQRGTYTVSARTGSGSNSFTAEVIQRITSFRIGYVRETVGGVQQRGVLSSWAMDWGRDTGYSNGNRSLNDPINGPKSTTTWAGIQAIRQRAPPVLTSVERTNVLSNVLAPGQDINTSPINSNVQTVYIKPGRWVNVSIEIQPAHANFFDSGGTYILDVSGVAGGGYSLESPSSELLNLNRTFIAANFPAAYTPRLERQASYAYIVDVTDRFPPYLPDDENWRAFGIKIITNDIVPDDHMVWIRPINGAFIAGSRQQLENGDDDLHSERLGPVEFYSDREEMIREYYLSTDRDPSFLIDKYAISQEQFLRVVGRNPNAGMTTAFWGDKRPVTNVTYWDVLEFCNKLSELEGFQPVYEFTVTSRDADGSAIMVTGPSYAPRAGWYAIYYNANGYRLPSAVEWDHACRYFDKNGGHRKPFTVVFNDEIGSDTIDSTQANFYSTATLDVDDGRYYTTLYHMHGNVWEWTSSTWQEAYVIYPHSPGGSFIDADIWPVFTEYDWRDPVGRNNPADYEQYSAPGTQALTQWPLNNDARLIKGGDFHGSLMSRFARAGGIYYQHDIVLSEADRRLDPTHPSGYESIYLRPSTAPADGGTVIGGGWGGIHHPYNFDRTTSYKSPYLGFRVVRGNVSVSGANPYWSGALGQ